MERVREYKSRIEQYKARPSSNNVKSDKVQTITDYGKIMDWQERDDCKSLVSSKWKDRQKDLTKEDFEGMLLPANERWGWEEWFRIRNVDLTHPTVQSFLTIVDELDQKEE